MHALYVIAWFVGIILSIQFMRGTLGYAGLCHMFPEGFRWYTVPLEILSMVIFAFAVLNHPF